MNVVSVDTLEMLRNKYLNKEVQVTISGQNTNFKRYNSDDPLLMEVSQFISSLGHCPRIFLPGQAGTLDYRIDRVNVYVMEINQGRFEISGINVG